MVIHPSLEKIIKKKFKRNIPLKEIYNIKTCGSTGFELTNKIGSGAYGVIYSAVCSKQKGFVVKIQEENALLEAVYTRIFSKERLAPKIFQVYSNTKYKATVIVMESMDHTLEKELVNNKKNPTVLCKLIRNTFALMNKLHFHGFIHGDAHIGNFMMKGKQIKMIDFGFSIEISYLLKVLQNQSKKYKKLYTSVYGPLKGFPQFLDILKLMINFTDFIHEEIRNESVKKSLIDCVVKTTRKYVNFYLHKEPNIFEPIFVALETKRLSVGLKMLDKAYEKLYYDACLDLIIINEHRLDEFNHKEVFDALEKELQK